MRMFKLKYILCWLAMLVIILDGLALLILSWNGHFNYAASPLLLVMLWTLLVAAAIYLFFFAARQTLADFTQNRKHNNDFSPAEKDIPNQNKKNSSDSEPINIEAASRKLIRGIVDYNSREETGSILLKNLAKELEIMSGLVYFKGRGGVFKAEASYAINNTDEPYKFKEGEGLSGQVAKNKQVSVLNNLPDGFLEVSSGLGNGKPGYLALIPVITNNETIIVIECAGFKYEFKDLERVFQLLSRELSAKFSESNS
jgi:NADH:ubiquinone oxidoreductase subunit 3 (subunit A)